MPGNRHRSRVHALTQDAVEAETVDQWLTLVIPGVRELAEAVLPTLADAAGVVLPPTLSLDGQSLLPLLLQPPTGASTEGAKADGAATAATGILGNNAGCLDRRIRTHSHGDANIGSCKRRGIIDAVTSHCDDESLLLQTAGDLRFFFWCRRGMHDLYDAANECTHMLQTRCGRLIGRLVMVRVHGSQVVP